MGLTPLAAPPTALTLQGNYIYIGSYGGVLDIYRR